MSIKVHKTLLNLRLQILKPSCSFIFLNQTAYTIPKEVHFQELFDAMLQISFREKLFLQLASKVSATNTLQFFSIFYNTTCQKFFEILYMQVCRLISCETLNRIMAFSKAFQWDQANLPPSNPHQPHCSRAVITMAK